MQGYTNSYIAEKYKISKSSVAIRIKKYIAYEKSKGNILKTYKQQQNEKIKYLYKKGHTIQYITSQIDLGYTTVWNRIQNFIDNDQI